jgi:hypothetical protein
LRLNRAPSDEAELTQQNVAEIARGRSAALLTATGM